MQAARLSSERAPYWERVISVAFPVTAISFLNNRDTRHGFPARMCLQAHCRTCCRDSQSAISKDPKILCGKRLTAVVDHGEHLRFPHVDNGCELGDESTIDQGLTLVDHPPPLLAA